MNALRTWGPFLEATGNYRAVLFSIPDGSIRRFENCTVKVSTRKTKLTSLEVRTRPTSFLETSKYDFGPVKLPGLSRIPNNDNNLTGPKPYFEVKVLRKVGHVLTSNEVYFVSLADNFTV